MNYTTIAKKNKYQRTCLGRDQGLDDDEEDCQDMNKDEREVNAHSRKDRANGVTGNVFDKIGDFFAIN